MPLLTRSEKGNQPRDQKLKPKTLSLWLTGPSCRDPVNWIASLERSPDLMEMAMSTIGSPIQTFWVAG